ncbi:efflux RND transporter periplasmic adaptor subunit [Rhizobium sp. YIM 134829]|uniref:efflux RND transporter periplasmic adaptor subunit n=1 Tax=Rhizobium sp. YIM 134829 TaxID=3390453 RepID=UPI003979D6BA
MVFFTGASLHAVMLRLGLLGAIGLALSSCSKEEAEVKEVIRPVKVVEIGAASGARTLTYSGSVRPRTEMNLGFRVAGKITERLVDVGDKVKPGDVLARIDPTDLRLAVKTAEADLAAAEQGVKTADLALNRARQLFSNNVTSQSQLEQATLTYEQAVSTRDAAVATLDQARNQVGYTELTATRPGIVTTVSADIGSVVAAGALVATVAVDGEKEVLIAVPEGDIAQFSPGKAVKASFWSDRALSKDGKVREVAGSADAQSRTFSVRISLPDDPRIRLGMTATVDAAADAEPVVSIPLTALAEQKGKPIVWIVDRTSEPTVHARDVDVAGFTDDGVRISRGLAAGDLVVSAGTQFMAESLKVKLPEQQSARAETNDILR